MAYTVNKLAKLSGVSVRTLHFYDKIDLLKPAYHGDNNYRYYEEEQLLMLQQILFYRKLGFSLNEIQKIISSDNFDKIGALQAHKEILQTKLNRTQQLIKTIDKTIDHLRGETKMRNEEMYYGFNPENKKICEKTLLEKSNLVQDFLIKCIKKIKGWNHEEKANFIKDIEKMMRDLIETANQGPPSSNEIQNLLQSHYLWLDHAWNPNEKE